MNSKLLFFILVVGGLGYFLVSQGYIPNPFATHVYTKSAFGDIFPIDFQWTLLYSQANETSRYPIVVPVASQSTLLPKAVVAYIYNRPDEPNILHIDLITADGASLSRQAFEFSNPARNGASDLRYGYAFEVNGIDYFAGVIRVSGNSYDVILCKLTEGTTQCSKASADPSSINNIYNRPVGIWYDPSAQQIHVLFIMFSDNPTTSRIDYDSYLVIDKYSVNLQTASISFNSRSVIAFPSTLEAYTTYRAVFQASPSGYWLYLYKYVNGGADEIYIYSKGSSAISLLTTVSGDVFSLGITGEKFYFIKVGSPTIFSFYSEGQQVATVYVPSDLLLSRTENWQILSEDTPTASDLQYEQGRRLISYEDEDALFYSMESVITFAKTDKNAGFAIPANDPSYYLESDIAFQSGNYVYNPSQAMVKIATQSTVFFILAGKDIANSNSVKVFYYQASPIYININSPESDTHYYKSVREIPLNITIDDRSGLGSYVVIKVTGTTCSQFEDRLPIIVYNGTLQDNIFIEDLSPLLVPLHPAKLTVEVYDGEWNLLAKKSITFEVTDPRVGIRIYPNDVISGYTGQTLNQTIEIYRIESCGENEQYYIDMSIQSGEGIVNYNTNPTVPGTYSIPYSLNITVSAYSQEEVDFSYTISVTHTNTNAVTSASATMQIEYQPCNLTITYLDGSTSKNFNWHVNETETIYTVVTNNGNLECSFRLYVSFYENSDKFEVSFREGPGEPDNPDSPSGYYSPIEYSINPGENITIPIYITPKQEVSTNILIEPRSDRYNLVANSLSGTINVVVKTCRATVELDKTSLSLWQGQSEQVQVTVTNLGNTICAYNLIANCPEGLTCTLQDTTTPSLNFGESYTTTWIIRADASGNFIANVSAVSTETGEVFYSPDVSIEVGAPITIQILSPTQTELHATEVPIHIKVYNNTPVTNPQVTIYFDGDVLFTADNMSIDYQATVPIGEGTHTIYVVAKSDEYYQTRTFTFRNELIKYIRINSPQSNKIYNVSEPIPIDIEAELWIPLTNPRLIVYLDGVVLRDAIINGKYIRYTAQVALQQPGLHSIYAVVTSEEVTRQSNYVYFSVGLPVDFKVYNTTFVELTDNELEKIYAAWKAAFLETDVNDLTWLAAKYIPSFISIENNTQLQKMAQAYATQFLELNDNELRKVFLVWLTTTLATEDNDLSKVFKEYITTTSELNVNDLYKIFKEYGLGDVIYENNDLRKVFATWLINQLSYENNDLTKIFSEYPIRFKAIEYNPLTGIIHEIVIYPTNFVSIELNDLKKIYEAIGIKYVESSENEGVLFKTQQTSVVEIAYNYLRKIFGVFETILRAGQMNPENTAGIVGSETPYIKLLTNKIPACAGTIEYEAVMPEADKPFYYLIDIYIGDIAVCRHQWSNTFIARAKCTVESFMPGTYTLKAVMTRYVKDENSGYYTKDIEKVDTSTIQVVLEPFSLKITQPADNQRFNLGDTITLAIDYATAGYQGMKYDLVIDVYREGVKVYNITDVVPAGTEGTLIYQITPNQPGAYTIDVRLLGVCSYHNLKVGELSDTVSFAVVSEEGTTPGGGGGGGVLPPTEITENVTQPITNITQPPVEITPIERIEKERKPQGIQSVIQQQPALWLIIIAAGFLLLAAISRRKREK